MNRYIIGSLWDRSNRNGANKNFEYLFEGSKRVDALNSRADNILSKSNASLNEAQKTNDMNKDVQRQLDEIILESGNSEAEVVQARGGYSVLNERLNETDSQLADTVKVSPGQPAQILFGVIRNVSGNWEWVEDATHRKMGFDNLEVVNGDLHVNHSFTAKEVGSIVIVPDETMASKNVSVGASVGVGQTRFTFYDTMECAVRGSGTVERAQGYVNEQISTEVLADGSGLRITHPTTRINDIPIVSMMYDQSIISSNDVKIDWGTNYVEVRHYAPLSGYVEYRSGEWNCLTDAIEVPTMSFDESTGILRVSHPNARAISSNYGIGLAEREGFRPVISTVSITHFDVVFKNEAGETVKTPSDNMRFYFTRNIETPSTMPGSLRVAIKRGRVKIPADRMLTGNGGNFWIYGAMNI